MHVHLPSQAGDAGEPVDTTCLANAKKIIVRGQFTGTLMIEATGSVDTDRPAFSTVAVFPSAGEKTIAMPAAAMRVRMPGLGSPEVIVEAAEGDVSGVALDVPTGDGMGEPVALCDGPDDLAAEKLICVGGPFLGTLSIDLSEDSGDLPTTWRTVAMFSAPGQRVISAPGCWARVRRQNSSAMGTPPVSICAAVAVPPPPPEPEEDLLGLPPAGA